ncbi:Alanine dehydrogenase [bacterium HR30]|nr:Alanine dehydrogenase [bacterium HR30]
MVVGVVKEIKPEENRVALTPAGVAALVGHGHEVWVERRAGVNSGLGDREYEEAGARLARSAQDVWRRAELLLKVKEPLPSEYRFLRRGLVLFTYLHLAANPELTQELCRRGVRAIGYETVELDDGSLPLLAPMSEVAGRLAIQVGAWCLQKQSGGVGILLSGASGVRPGKVVVLGAGTAGSNAAQIAFGLGAHVSVIDANPAKLRYLHDILGGHITTVMSNRANIEEEVRSADLLIGAVLVPGARAPRLVTRSMVRKMRPGSAIVDISIDQGGCVETSRPTTLEEPTYVAENVVHYCVTNMPSIVPRTSTFALTNATFAYALEIADKGMMRALRENRPLRRGVNVFDGHVVHPAVATAVGVPQVPIEDLLE